MEYGLLCGAAKADITPEREQLMHLSALGNKGFACILDKIYLRVIAVGDGERTALIITCDLDKVPCPEENIAAISEVSGIPEEYIFQLSIHTHTAPIAGFRPHEGPNNIATKHAYIQAATKGYEVYIRELMVNTVLKAIDNMQPAKMGYGYGKSYINVNRVQTYEYFDEEGKLSSTAALGADPSKPADPTLFVLKFETLNGAPIAFLTNYAVHNCVMIGNYYGEREIGLSSDMGGTVSKYMEEKFPGCVALWTSGAAGDINPVMSNEVIYPDPATGRPVSEPIKNPEIPQLMLRMLAARHFDDTVRTLRTVECRTETAMVKGGVVWSETEGNDGEPYRVRIHAVTIGSLALCGFSGELYSSIGAQLREASPFEDTVILNHDASLAARIGYIFDDETLKADHDLNLPGHRQTRMKPGCVAVSLEKNMVKLLKEMM